MFRTARTAWRYASKHRFWKRIDDFTDANFEGQKAINQILGRHFIRSAELRSTNISNLHFSFYNFDFTFPLD